MRPTDPLEIKGLPGKANRYLSWRPELLGAELVFELVKKQMETINHDT